MAVILIYKEYIILYACFFYIVDLTEGAKCFVIMLSESVLQCTNGVGSREEKNGLSAKNLMLTLVESCNVLLDPNRGFAIYPIVTSDPLVHLYF
jgi:hypothetical protein